VISTPCIFEVAGVALSSPFKEILVSS
jgi:hypothetical protein